MTNVYFNTVNMIKLYQIVNIYKQIEKQTVNSILDLRCTNSKQLNIGKTQKYPQLKIYFIVLPWFLSHSSVNAQHFCDI